MRRPSVGIITQAALATAAVPLALAEEGTHGHEAGSPLVPLFFSTINLLIFLWVLARYVVPPIRAWVRSRRTHIVQALETAAAAKAEALRLRTEWEERLAQFNQSLEAMRTQARRDAEHERDQILAAARKAADAIRKDAELAAVYEMRRTQELLRADLVRQAVRSAEDAARTQLTEDDQQRFVTEFLKQVRQ
jgi:F-type H+-transporting ATPase subunit b